MWGCMRKGRFKLDYLRDIFWLAATSSNKVAFLKAMDEIMHTSPEAHAYLSNISLETWAVHAFDSECKSEHNTNNVMEAFNVKCITKKRDNVEDYVHDYLKKSTYLRTYANNFHAIPDENLWSNGDFKTVLPPIKKKGVGRSRLSRIRGPNEPKKVKRSVGFRCGICKKAGHNSRTCKNKSHPEVGSNSTLGGPDSTHLGQSSTHTGNATTTGFGGSTTTAASPYILGNVTRVI
ncbi:hypothetical protein Ddye_027293 [Dipteronia dyeriana]|uniref:Uncharacterized protein n=1 Tax=Dipteronia dyeriana TaxID=168575 RepID=A0AAD9WR90_9ROSI|nr:hypothetical protein Ddye_027293 [Dipteronia dyeriana]